MVQHLRNQHTRHAVVAEARNWIETPYQHQASLKGVGCDCLGLVRGVWRGLYGSEPCIIPAYSADWAEAGKNENLLSAAANHLVGIEIENFQTGDLLAFRWRSHLPAKHLAIVSSPTTMIHAQQGAKVCEVPLSQWWRRHIAGAFRFPSIKPNHQGANC